jgi:hypothetical protein
MVELKYCQRRFFKETMMRLAFVAVQIAALLTVQAAQKQTPVKGGTRQLAFEVNGPVLEVRGTNLAKVEVWYWSTGTGVSKPTLLGLARRKEQSTTVWTFPIPSEPLLAVEVFTKAFDKDGRLLGTKSLPYKGAGAVYEALYERRRQ